MLADRLGADKDGGQIGRHHPVPLVQGYLHQRLGKLPVKAIDQNIYVAELAYGRGHHFLHFPGTGDIGGDRHGTPPHFLHGLSRCGHFRVILTK